MPPFTIGRVIALIVFVIVLVLVVLLLADVAITQAPLLILGLVGALALAFLIG